MPFIEITQDGAGYVSSIEPADGLYTKDIKTCVVLAVRSNTGICLIHDTGELSLDSMSDVLRRIGHPLSIFVAQNDSGRTSDGDEKLHARLEALGRRLAWTLEPEMVKAPDGAIAFSKDGSITPGVMSQAHLQSAADRAERMLIGYVNNAFTPKDAQSIPVDLQFENGSFTPRPKMLRSRWSMENIARNELKRGRPTCDFFLKEAILYNLV